MRCTAVTKYQRSLPPASFFWWLFRMIVGALIFGGQVIFIVMHTAVCWWNLSLGHFRTPAEKRSTALRPPPQPKVALTYRSLARTPAHNRRNCTTTTTTTQLLSLIGDARGCSVHEDAGGITKKDKRNKNNLRGVKEGQDARCMVCNTQQKNGAEVSE